MTWKYEAIQRAISVFNWIMLFQNKDINEKFKILYVNLSNIINNLTPNKISKLDYKKPVWINKEITLLLDRRSKLTNKYYNGPTDMMVSLANECTKLIIAAKEKFHPAKSKTWGS